MSTHPAVLCATCFALVIGCSSPEQASPSAPAPKPSAEPTAAEASHVAEPPRASAKVVTKATATPYFWQRDPEAAFPNGGADYCAPVSLSSGLMYLAAARGMTALVTGEDTKSQIALVKELAKDLATDPKEGTSTDLVVTGIERFVRSKGFSVKKLEVATWRSLSKENTAHSIGQKPELDWIRAATLDPDTIVLANVGWYKKDPKGLTRDGGHWVDVVGVGSQPGELHIRNSLLKAEDQRSENAVTLTRIEPFLRVSGKDTVSMSGYYKVEGPALPHGAAVVAAVLDGVVAFSVKK